MYEQIMQWEVSSSWSLAQAGLLNVYCNNYPGGGKNKVGLKVTSFLVTWGFLNVGARIKPQVALLHLDGCLSIVCDTHSIFVSFSR